MLQNKKPFILLAFIIFIIAGFAATTPPPDHTFKNLKVFPKNISSQQLYKAMHEFNKDLGVSCSFCHSKSDANPDQIDFASDKKGEKGIARSMMRMAMKINKKFFHVSRPAIGD